MLLTTFVLTDNIASRAALFDSRPVVVPEATTGHRCDHGSVLTSSTDVPLVRVVLVSAKVSESLSPASTVMTGRVVTIDDNRDILRVRCVCESVTVMVWVNVSTTCGQIAERVRRIELPVSGLTAGCRK
ncbi:MAG: hypothetical protein KF752_10190 [Pirellulaceae bacterium]|nr:hypothetical protein [Pirellulaceae bacterium]